MVSIHIKRETKDRAFFFLPLLGIFSVLLGISFELWHSHSLKKINLSLLIVISMLPLFRNMGIAFWARQTQDKKTLAQALWASFIFVFLLFLGLQGRF